jgi:hypothetical protein
MNAAPDLLLGENGEPALDYVDPGRAGRGEVQVEARVASQSAMDQGRLVGAVVVKDEVDLELGRNLPRAPA